MVDTKTEILDAAQSLCQRLGHRGFSFRDLAASLGIKSSSVHHHFPSKDQLLQAMVVRYRENFAKRLGEISASAPDSRVAIRSLVGELEGLLVGEAKLCLCGMLATESEVLSDELKDDLKLFFEGASTWLGGVLEAGRSRGELSFAGDSKAVALAIVSSLQGMLIASRVLGGAARFREMSGWILGQLEAGSSPQECI